MFKKHPFLHYTGSKFRLLKKCKEYYPEPKYETIVELCAGSASYSLLWMHKKNVKKIILCEKNASIFRIWNYLINKSSADRIRNLPDLEIGESFHEAGRFENLNQPEKELIGYNINYNNTVKPQKNVTKKTKWNPKTKENLIRCLPFIQEKFEIKFIKKFKPKGKNYNTACGMENFFECYSQDNESGFDPTTQPATYFIDPPYQAADGQYDKKGKISPFSYKKLIKLIKKLKGQIIICEGERIGYKGKNKPTQNVKMPEWISQLPEEFEFKISKKQSGMKYIWNELVSVVEK